MTSVVEEIVSEKGLPSNVLAEQFVLGAVLLDNLAIEYIADLSPGDFFREQHRVIFAHALKVARAGKPIDYVTLSESLEAAGELDKAGGLAYLTRLTEGAPRSINIRHYAEIVRERARRRELLNVCRSGAADAAADVESSQDIAARLEAQILGMAAGERNGGIEKLGACVDAELLELEAIRQGKRDVVKLTTGLTDLDKLTTGPQTGELWVVGGWPGTGKSSLAIQMAVANAARERPVLFFSLELRRREIARRIFAAVGCVDYLKLRWGQTTDEESARVRQAATDVRGWPLLVDDPSSLRIHELLARARLYVRREGVQLVFVDYVQLVDAPGQDVRNAVSAVSAGLREFAKTEVPVVALSQLRRKSNATERPTKYHLKETGNLEADAHVVLLLYRPEENGGCTGQDEIIVDKQRSGPTGSVSVFYREETLKYEAREVRRAFTSARSKAGGNA